MRFHPFGQAQQGRSGAGNAYRFGFNGKENDEWGGTKIQDYGFRLYNPSIGRFLSFDPLSPEYPELTPYQFASNSPIAGSDLDGLEFDLSTTNGKDVGLNAEYIVVNSTGLSNKVVEQHMRNVQRQYASAVSRKATSRKEISYFGKLTIPKIVNKIDDVEPGDYYIHLVKDSDERLPVVYGKDGTIKGKRMGYGPIGGTYVIAGFSTEKLVMTGVTPEGEPIMETQEVPIQSAVRTIMHEIFHNAGLFHNFTKRSEVPAALEKDGITTVINSYNIYARAKKDINNGEMNSYNVKAVIDNAMNSDANPTKQLKSTTGTKLDLYQLDRVHDHIYNDKLPRPIYRGYQIINPPVEKK